MIPTIGIGVAGMAQTFYAWRIYCLTQSLWLPVLIELVGPFALCIKMLLTDT